jgi:hypothetical protein
MNEGTITQSYATGDATGGGLVAQEAGIISNSYSTGIVESQGGGGGLLETTGGSGATVTSSYSAGAVQNGDGGFACDWYNGDIATSDYWDTTTSGTGQATCNGNVAGVAGLTTAQLRSSLPAGFDPSIWAESKKINNGLPYLINNPPQ